MRKRPVRSDTRPDPYCTFKDDRELRLALEDRNRRDVHIVRWRVIGLALMAIAAASSKLDLLAVLHAWLP